jgi:hypothetical protein
MLSFLLHILAWLIVLVMGLGLLCMCGWVLTAIVSALLSPFSKKVEEFHRRHFECHGPWIWW